MSRILVAVTPLAGHVNPMLIVAESLGKAGHEVFFNTADLFRERVEAAGLRFLPLRGNANYDFHHLGELIPELWTAAPGMDQANCYLKYLIGDRIPDQYRSLRQNIREYAIDLVMTDILFLGNLPLLLSGEPRPPVISCGVIAPSWHDPAFSVFTGPDNTPEGRQRNLEHSRQFDALRAPGNTHVNVVLERLGVAVTGGFNVNAVYRLPDLFLQFGVESFEYPMSDRPTNLLFTGPILPRQEQGMPAPAWLAKLDGSRPVVFVTQGTLANFKFNQLVNPALAGLAREDLQVVVTAGGSKAGEIVPSANAIVEPYIAYETVLPKTHVFVTNGGYNGVQQALSFGVPVVSAGESEDKPIVSARVAWSGTGINLNTGSPTPEQIRKAVYDILRDPRYSERARILGAEIAKTDALRTITEIVEATISTIAPMRV